MKYWLIKYKICWSKGTYITECINLVQAETFIDAVDKIIKKHASMTVYDFSNETIL